MKHYENSLPRFELKTVQTDFPRIVIDNPRAGADFIRQFYGDDIHIFESFFILLLNNQQETIGFAKISQGGVTSTIVDSRLVALYAVQSLAVSIILAHNHPSGAIKPSESDITLTNQITDGLKLLNIKVLDHIILTGSAYYSFLENK